MSDRRAPKVRPKVGPRHEAWIKQGTPVANRYARALSKRFPSVGEDELRSIGNEHLVEAALDFEPERGHAFAAFATARLKGRMIDSALALNRQPGVTVLPYLQRAVQAVAVCVDPDVDPEFSDADAVDDFRARAGVLGAALFLSYLGASSPESQLGRAQLTARMHAVVHDALGALPDDERRLMELRYWDDLSLTDAAARSGMSYRTAVRRHTAILSELQARLRTLGFSSAR